MIFKLDNKKRKEIVLVEVNNDKGCIECTSHHHVKGRPVVSFEGKMNYLSKLVYERYKEKVPEGNVVRHTCDNPACVNPEHLILGTMADNCRDRDERGRAAVGEKSGKVKLTTAQVYEILAAKGTDKTGVELAKEYGIDNSTIYRIWKGKRWQHLTDPEHPQYPGNQL